MSRLGVLHPHRDRLRSRRERWSNALPQRPMIYENDHVMNLTGSLGLELNRPANDDVRVRVIRGDAWSRPGGIAPQTDALTLARRSPRRCAGTWKPGRRAELSTSGVPARLLLRPPFFRARRGRGVQGRGGAATRDGLRGRCWRSTVVVWCRLIRHDLRGIRVRHFTFGLQLPNGRGTMAARGAVSSLCASTQGGTP